MVNDSRGPRRLDLIAARPGRTVSSLVCAMLLGADSIDDCELRARDRLSACSATERWRPRPLAPS